MTIYSKQNAKIPGVKSSSGMSADAAKETTEKVLKAVGYVRKLQALQTPFSQRFGGEYIYTY